jgi:hypothetical protein
MAYFGDNIIKNDVALGIVFYGLIVVAAAQTIKIGPAELSYGDSGIGSLNSKTVMPGGVPGTSERTITVDNERTPQFIIDAPISTIRKNSNEMDFFISNWQGIDKCLGTPFEPFQKRYWGAPREKLWTNSSVFLKDRDPHFGGDSGKEYWRDVPWISNIYMVKDAGIAGVRKGDLLGFVHVECAQTPKSVALFYRKTIYKIGLAYSRVEDKAEKWTYCADILFAKDPFGEEITDCKKYPHGNGMVCPGVLLNNIGGVPYVVKNDSFYVYFMDWDTAGTGWNTRGWSGRICAAKARVKDVLKEVSTRKKASPVSYPHPFSDLWRKYDGSAWSIKGNSTVSAGKQIINPYQGNPALDIHGDAAYCVPLKKYLVTVDMPGDGKLLLYSSKDGLRWNTEPPIELDNDTAWKMPHSFFASLAPDAADDCHVVGKQFYIIWPRTKNSDGSVQELWRRKIEIVE